MYRHLTHIRQAVGGGGDWVEGLGVKGTPLVVVWDTRWRVEATLLVTDGWLCA